MLESAAAFLFETFINASSVGHQQTVKLRGLFGPFPASSATKTCALVGRMVKNIPDDVVDDLVESFKSGEEEKVEFGQGFKFVYPEGDDDNSDDDDLTSESEDDEDAAMDFDFKYTIPDTGMPEGAIGGVDKEKGSGPWLLAQVELYFSGDNISIAEMASTILNLLKSSKTDDELQNDLFDLLGFDRFEFIQTLFQNRPKLQKVAVESLNSEPPPRIIQAVKVPKEKRPNYGCQVTVEVSTLKLVMF
jgi:activating signal cointegrator complex subunit 3